MTPYPDEDAAALRVIRESRAVSVVAGLVAAGERAWAHSRARRMWHGRVLPGPAVPSAQQRWLVSAALSASLVALALQQWSPDPVPLMWMLPAAVAVAAALSLVGSGRSAE